MSHKRSLSAVFRSAGAAACCGLSLLTFDVAAQTEPGDNNECDITGEAPDLIVGELFGIHRWGSVGDVTAFSFGSESCNVGTCEANWFAIGTDHPVIAHNIYRLKDGKFEQIGQSWVRHGFAALSQSLCASPDDPCIPTNGTTLGVNCSHPAAVNFAADQFELGPKFEVNASTGEFLWPFTGLGEAGNAIYKRLQVHNDDLDPALNPGARYWVEAHYVSFDEAQAGNGFDNASYREVEVLESAPGVFDLLWIGPTGQRPAILAWAE